MSRSRILIALLVLLCLALTYAWLTTPRQRRIPTPSSRLSPPESETPALASLPVVRPLDFSDGQNSVYHAPVKNLFGPLYLPPPVQKPRPAATARPKPRPTRPEPQKIMPAARPSGPKPIPALTVLGYLSRGQHVTVFLAARTGEIYLVKQGDSFADGLVVQNIDTRGVTVVHAQSGQKAVLPVGEAKSQRLPTVRFQSDRPAFVPPEVSADKPEPGTGTGVVEERKKVE